MNKVKLIKQICPKQMIQQAQGPILDYQIWLKTKFGRGYRRCASGPQCYNQGGQCKYDHYELYKPTQSQYYNNVEFNRLVAERNKLGYQFGFDRYDSENIDQSTNQYKEAFKRYKYLNHLFVYHKKAHYKMSCKILASQGCIKLGYCKDPKYAEKQKKIKKLEKIRHMVTSGGYQFMTELIGFGWYSNKTWEWVQKRHPQMIDEYLQNQFAEESDKEIIKAIIQRRKASKLESQKQQQKQQKMQQQEELKQKKPENALLVQREEQKTQKQPENALLAQKYFQKMTHQYCYRRYVGSKLPCDNSMVSVVGMIKHLDQKLCKIIIQFDSKEKTTLQISVPRIGLFSQFRQGKYIEVMGMSKKDSSVEMREYTHFNDDFDLDAYNQVINLTLDSKFKSMFGL